ncbi:MAG: hypothetical protein KC464_12945, partial [Myxococcales bacterium]|nr:hypothetical protein [Myxococcales bacterium]
MPSRHASSRALRRAVVLAALIALGGGVIRDARSASVANFMTAKSLPDATVAVLDPESGTSSNPGSDVALEVGDIILFKFAFSPAPANSVHGVNGYLTEYVPPGTELVGVRFTDAAGNTIRPNRAGLSIEGCQGGSLCNSFSSVPCATGTCSFQTGSIAQVYADTGVFYATDPDLSPSPNNLFLNTDNGIPMTGGEEPRAISPEITQLLNDTSGPYNAHNDWDYDQVRAYGGSTSVVSNGDGNTPYLYGSPVAGPDTFYRYEATDTGGAIQLNNVLGPWLRIQSPGSRIGTGAGNIGASTTMSRVGVPTGAGHDLTPATAVSPTAVRFAGGEARVGEPVFAEVALRVLSVPIDPTFGAGAGNVDCAEATGSDISSKSANSGGGNNAWPYYIGAAQCVFLRLKFDVEVSKPVASVGDTLHYVLNGKNLSLDPETGVVAKLKYVESDQTYVTATPAPTRIQTCPGESNKTCVEWDLGTLQPGDEYVLEADIDVQGQGGGTNVVVGQYESNELDAINPGGFETTALTVVQPVAIPKLAMTNTLDPTANFAAAGSTTWAVNGTLVNAGTTNWGNDSLVVTLPTGWSITNGQIVVGGTTFSCTGGGCATSNVQTFSTSQTYASLQSRAISFAVTVPAGAATGLYTFDVQAYGDQNVFGKFETLFPEAVTIPVGAVRTAPPILQCQPPTSQPIISTQPTISGTSEADAAIRLLFSLIQRGTATADGAGAWTVANYLPGFGELYGGLEVRATAQAPGKLISVESASCIVAGTKQCSDGLDNDGDGLADFPADPGCDSPSDNTETDPGPPQCSDGLDNDGANGADWPADPSCDGPTDDTEDGTPSCSDGIDNDGDGLTDFPDDPDCSSAQDGTETFYRQCQDGLDNDGDGEADFAGAGGLPGDDGCDALFDDDESDTGFTPVDTRARLLIALDSSGSMNWETCSDDFTGGDGSTECAGADVACACNGSCNNALADDSRLFKVKNGIANVVAAFGEVEYSLMRFHQKPENFLCPTAAAGRQSGGWQGGGAAPCAGGFAS